MTTTEDHWYDPGTGKTFHFNEEGMLVDDEEKGPQRGFKNNDSFSDWIHHYVECRLVDEGLVKMTIPEDSQNGAPIYFTPGAPYSPDKLLVLICGSGRIHVGLWSVGVCAYHGLNAGSVLSFLAAAKKNGMEVVVLNPNHPASKQLRGRGFHEEFGMILHTLYVFKNLIIEKWNPASVYCVCHSMGGECIISIIETFSDWVKAKVIAVALTDACTSPISNKEMAIWCNEAGRCINWVRSKKKLGTKLGIENMCECRSAETDDHPLTTYKAFDEIWEFFAKMAEKGISG